MKDHHIDIKTKHGVMNTFITHPEEGGPHPVVLFLMDAPGKREELHDMARRIATATDIMWFYPICITASCANLILAAIQAAEGACSN